MGNNIAKIREKKGMSQVELARALNLDRSHMNRIERGKRNIGISLALRIANVLNCPVEELFFNQDVDQ